MKRKKQLAPKANPKRPKNINELAHLLVKESTREKTPEATPVTASELSRVMAELGRRGGKIGGKKRAAALSGVRRMEIALKAARARWDKTSVPEDIEPLPPRRVKSKA